MSVPLRFRKSTAVAIGTFNIYVIQPRWLVEVGLLQKTDKVLMEADLTRPGFKFTQVGRARGWEVRPDRLVIESEQPDEDCGSALADILDKLPWTPLTAVGTNVTFAGDLSDLDRMAGACAFPPCEPPEGHKVVQRTLHIGIQVGDNIFNLQVNRNGEAEVSINAHTELKNKGSQADTNRAAQAECRKFFAHRTQGVALATNLFKLDLSHERNRR